MNRKKVMLTVAGFAFVVAIGVNVYMNSHVSTYSYLPPAENTDKATDLSSFAIEDSDDFPMIEFDYGTTTYWDKKIFVDENFSSEIPIVIIDVGSDEIHKSMEWDGEKGYMVAIEGIEQSTKSVVSIIDNENDVNKASDTPSLTSDVLVSIRGNTSQGYDKKQYKVVLTDEEYLNKDMQVLDIGEGHEWVLNGAFSDSTMMRNYIAYTLAGEISPNTPDTKYVEVLIKNDSGYEYQGLYLLMESIERSSDRVDISRYSANSKNHATFIMKRDRFSEDGVFLDNYGKQNDLTPGFIEILYPNNINNDDLQLLSDKISDFERALYSDDPEIFSQYKDFIDVQSFQDYFILNELFMNYDAGFNSTYFHSDYSGEIIMGPIWDFDLAFNNDRFIEGNFEATAFHQAPWFDKLLQDPWFISGLVARYHELRENELSDERITNLIETTEAHLGTSIDREWDRWGYYYSANLYNAFEYEDQSTAEKTTYSEEVDKIREAYFKHSSWLDGHIDSLYQFSEPSFNTGEEVEIDWSAYLGYAFIVVWLASVVILQRRMN